MSNSPNPSDARRSPSPSAVAVTSCGQTETGAAYAKALDYLYGRINYEKIGHAPYTDTHYRLDRMRQLLAALGDPQLRYQILHIAGTKGKGTVAHALADCLTACGFVTGLYTSPHLHKLEERFCVASEPASREELIELTELVRAAAEQVHEAGGGRATFFEMTTAIGLMHFARKSADCVVLEVGLGGRLDSTNVCQPVLSIITSISLDHQAQLGNTIAEIAGEKAGIIKAGTPVVATAREPEARRVIEARAAELHAPLRMLDRDFQVDWQPVCGDELRTSDKTQSPVAAEFRVSSTAAGAEAQVFETRMLGQHQSDNLAAVLTALEVLRELGWNLPPARIADAIARTQPPARMQMVGVDPVQIIDTAHNPASIAAALRTLDMHFRGKSRTILFASSRDKDFRNMLSQLLAACDHLVLTNYCNNPRAVAAVELQALAAEIVASCGSDCQVHLAENPACGWDLARSLTDDDALLLATGSFFLVAELPVM